MLTYNKTIINPNSVLISPRLLKQDFSVNMFQNLRDDDFESGPLPCLRAVGRTESYSEMVAWDADKQNNNSDFVGKLLDEMQAPSDENPRKGRRINFSNFAEMSEEEDFSLRE